LVGIAQITREAGWEAGEEKDEVISQAILFIGG
jgi:hypothetical protein